MFVAHRYRARIALALAFALGTPVWLVARKKAKRQGPFSIQTRSQLVNLTITATDGKGNPVTGLKPGDIIVKDEGKPQTLLNFRPAVTQTARGGSATTVKSPTLPANEAVPTRPENPDYIAFVMDDSTTGYVDLRQSILAAEKWVREDMTPSDRVGLVSISYGVKVWQPFTNDRDLLLRRLHAMLHERPAEDLKERIDDLLRDPDFPCSPRGAVGPGPLSTGRGGGASSGGGPNDGRSAAASDVAGSRLADRWAEEERPRLPDQFSWLRSLVDMLRIFPGQKRVIYLGDGFLMNPRRFVAYAVAAYCGGSINFGVSTYPYTLHSVIDAATRAGVTFYTIDARGLIAEPLGGGAAENFPPPAGNANALAFYGEKLHAPEDPLNELAHDTGGIAYNNGNDLTYFIRRAVNSIEGTYYASYRPPDIQLNGLYHKITIRSLLPGVKVRTRGGYYARPVHEFQVRAKVLKMEKRAYGYFVPVKFILNPSELQWQGIVSHRHDQLAVSNRLENSRGQLVTARIQLLDAAHPRSGRLTFDIGWNLEPGTYSGTVEVTEQDTSNFGSVVFALNVPGRSVRDPKPGRPAGDSGETYVDLSPAELANRVHALKGIEPAKSQAELPQILDRAGRAVAAFFNEFPNTTCTETVSVIIGSQAILEPGTYAEKFNYLALAGKGPDKTALREYRTDSKGNQVRSASMGLFATTGFVGMVAYFHPMFQPESNFRYVGKQQMDGRDACVVSFAQIPDRARQLVTISAADQSEKVLVQGVAWIDPATYEILRMRTDMLEARGPLNVHWLSTDVEYSPVGFEHGGLTLWLPQTVKVAGQTDRYTFHTQQLYSHYRVFNVKSTIHAQTR